MMKLNHAANRLDAKHFETIVDMLKTRLGFIELRRTDRAIWLRQPGANVDLQFSRSQIANRDADKLRSQVSFLSEAQRRKDRRHEAKRNPAYWERRKVRVKARNAKRRASRLADPEWVAQHQAEIFKRRVERHLQTLARRDAREPFLREQRAKLHAQRAKERAEQRRQRERDRLWSRNPPAPKFDVRALIG